MAHEVRRKAPSGLNWEARSQAVDGILDTVGLTPMVALRRLAPDGCEVLCKIEYFSPSGSIKDRVVPYIVRRAIERGELKPGMTIIEATTGNTGIATAMVGAALGYPVLIVMPQGMSRERQRTIQAYGAQLELTAGGESDVDLVMDRVKELRAVSPGQFFEVGQFSNQDNVEAHYATTGPEIWAQAQGRLDAFVASQGTGGTITGVTRYLKEVAPHVRSYAVEPGECPILSGGAWGTHRIEGIGDGFIPEVLAVEELDGVIQVSSDEAVEMARRLAKEEAIFCGISSGCNVVACLKLWQRHPELARIVTMINDNGLRYLSTELTTEPTTLDIPDREHPLDPVIAERLARAHLEIIR